MSKRAERHLECDHCGIRGTLDTPAQRLKKIEKSLRRGLAQDGEQSTQGAYLIGYVQSILRFDFDGACWGLSAEVDEQGYRLPCPGTLRAVTPMDPLEVARLADGVAESVKRIASKRSRGDR